MEGNQQKMREALTNLTRYGESDIRQLEQLAKRAIDNDIYGGGILQSLCEAIREGREALSAPARNCDKYVTQPEMSMPYDEYRKSAMKNYGNGLTGRVPTIKQKPMTYDEWLLAPAEERKGVGDGSK